MKRRKVEVEVAPVPSNPSGGVAAPTLPFAVYFPSGSPSTAASAGTSEELEFKVFAKTSGRGQHQVLVGSRVRGCGRRWHLPIRANWWMNADEFCNCFVTCGH